MKLKLLKRKSWSDESGVSEIIGNILILMITVVLFSGIMMFVNQMPVPELTTKTDFAASVEFEYETDLTLTATLTITHIGGAVMDSTEALVLVSIDEMTEGYRLSEAEDAFTLEEWSMGAEWVMSYNSASPGYSALSPASSISVTIVDDISHNAVWTSQVSGGMGGTPPTILQRYVDSDVDTISADPVKEYDDFTLFVKVTDLDKDLESVWVDSNAIVGGEIVDSFDEPSSGLVAAEGGWFQWHFNDVADNAALIDGKTLTICAEDSAGHATKVAYKLSVIELPTDTENIYTYEPPQEGGMPSYIKNINDGQGFGVYGQNGTTGTADIEDARTTFARGEWVFVRVASLYLTNIFGSNDLTFTDSRTDIDFTYLVGWEALSTEALPFYSYAYGGNVAVYQAVFNTSNMLPGAYSMDMLLKTTGATNYVFDASQTLYITDVNAPMSYYPIAWTFKDAGYTTQWGDTKTTPFNASATDYKVYVAMYVQDAVDTASPSVGEVRIVDMVGGTQLYGPPSSGTMISAVTKSASNSTAYIFSIDLRLNNGDKWKTGTNSYTLEIAQFSDSNEGVYSYSRQIFVKASTARSDFFMATNGIYSSKGGSTNFISPEYVYYTENNNFFTTRVLYNQENAPSTSPLFYHNAISLGDLDSDGDQDLLVGSNMEASGSSYVDFGQLLYFENTMNTWGIWQSPSVITRPTGDASTAKIEWIDMGDINADGDMDFAYSTNAHKVIIYNNTYGSGGTVFATYSSTNDGVRKVALEDMTGDGRADLIVLAEGKIYMYDLTKWTGGLFAQLPISGYSGSNIEDFDIADMNQDGMLDIITVDPSPASNDLIEGVWVNNYTANPTPEMAKVDSDEAILQPAGYLLSGDSSSTEAVDGTPMSIRENTTNEVYEGQLSFIYTIETPLSSYTDQQLVVWAKVSSYAGDDAQEVFYVWYSTDTDPLSTRYTPVMVVSGGSYVNYTFNLPPSMAGATRLYIKVTDSSTQLGLSTEQIDIDYIAVLSHRFGSYWPDPMTSPPTRYQVTGVSSADQIYTTARAFNFDGLADYMLEVVVAKNGKWAVYDNKTLKTDWMIQGQTNFYVYPGGLATSVAISPTLFEVADVNGDGLDDILTVWVSVGSSSEQSLLKVYINVDPTIPWPVNVKDLFSGMLPGTETGCIVAIASGDIYNRT